MLTSIAIRNFKQFDNTTVELASPVVFIGPNNSGKTSAMQALALWSIGLKRWLERGGKRQRAVTINRQDLFALPVPQANLLWRNLHVRNSGKNAYGKQTTSNVLIHITVNGVTNGRTWSSPLEFDYANPESLYCRPLRLNGTLANIPDEAKNLHIAFLPPMSGLAAAETRLPPGAVNVRIGEGRTAEVLRNLCHSISRQQPDRWKQLVQHIHNQFGATIETPRDVPERGEITMSYTERDNRSGKDVRFDLSSSGRGLQQTLLLLAYLYANDGAVLLLDEPDAHLEIPRQRETYRMIASIAASAHNQCIIASHSEVILDEAAEKDVVIAFVGKPHRIDNRGSQLRKSLRDIPFSHYYQAEQTGWALYLEGSTDLAILQAFAERLRHQRAIQALQRPFVHYTGNLPAKASDHFHGLREAFPHLKGLALFDRLEPSPASDGLRIITWRRREIENYLCSQATLENLAAESAEQDEIGLSVAPEAERRLAAMRQAIDEVAQAMTTLRRGSPWSPDCKASDDFLAPLFETYYSNLNLPNLMNKSAFHSLVPYVPNNEIDPEISAKLDAIANIHESASPH